MAAVTGSAREYVDRQLEDCGTVELVMIERCDAENEAGGWEIYWFDDGSNTGSILMEAWGWSGDTDGVQPVGMSIDDVFTDAEQETLAEREETRVPAPFGVRYRTVSEAEFDSIEDWEDLAHLMTLGTVSKRYWDVWMDRLCA
jgi:hypothetical protein